MAEAVYILCALTSLACTVLLLRGYFRTPTPLLLWSSICFAGLTLNNVLLYVDLVLLAGGPDLMMYRDVSAFLSMSILVYGLIWEAD